jgi:hypothetical protein
MTMQASGSMTLAQIADEVDDPIPFVLDPNGSAGWLADRAGLSITMPTHFYSKRALKLMDQAGDDVDDNQFSQVMTFGDYVAGRDMICVVHTRNDDGNSMAITSATLGGTAITFITADSRNGGECGCSIGIASPTTDGTGTVTINFEHFFTACYVVLISAMNIGTSVDSKTVTQSGNDGSYSVAINAGTNGVVIQAATRSGPSDVLTPVYTTDLVDTNFGGDMQCWVSAINSTTTGAKTIGFSDGTGSRRLAFCARSFT